MAGILTKKRYYGDGGSPMYRRGGDVLRSIGGLVSGIGGVYGQQQQAERARQGNEAYNQAIKDLLGSASEKYKVEFKNLGGFDLMSPEQSQQTLGLAKDIIPNLSVRQGGSAGRDYTISDLSQIIDKNMPMFFLGSTEDRATAAYNIREAAKIQAKKAGIATPTLETLKNTSVYQELTPQQKELFLQSFLGKK